MRFMQWAGKKKQKPRLKRGNMSVCRRQNITKMNQCGIVARAGLPKSKREEDSCGKGTEREESKNVLPLQTEKAESEGASACMVERSTLRWQSQRVAMAKHARCDGKVSAQAFFGQYAAKRKGTRWFVGHKKPPIGNEHTAPRKEVKINGSKKALKTILRYLTMRGQPYMRAKRRCLMCRIHFASWTGALHTSTVQPKAGRSENIYYFAK